MTDESEVKVYTRAREIGGVFTIEEAELPAKEARRWIVDGTWRVAYGRNDFEPFSPGTGMSVMRRSEAFYLVDEISGTRPHLCV